jgi:hypothetical protein
MDRLRDAYLRLPVWGKALVGFFAAGLLLFTLFALGTCLLTVAPILFMVLASAAA